MKAANTSNDPDTLTVRRIDWSAEARTIWSDFRAGQDRANPLADPAWFNILAQSYRPSLSLFVARRKNGAVAGILPTYTVRDIRGGRHLYSLRHGLTAVTVPVAESLCAAVEDHCRATATASALVTSGEVSLVTQHHHWTRASLTLSLPSSTDILWASFRDKVRNTIRKAERNGVVFCVMPSAVDTFWSLEADAMAAQLLPVKSRRFFRAIVGEFGNRARLHTASLDNALIGGMLVILGDGIASYAYGAFNSVGRNLGANSALMWKVAESLIGEGYTELDLGESTAGGGTYKFKERIGGLAVPIHYADPLRAAMPDDQTKPRKDTTALPPPGRFLRMAGRLPTLPRRAALTWLGGRGRIV